MFTDLLVELRWNPVTPCSGYVAFAWSLDGGDLVITALGPRTEARWLKEAYPGTWKRVDCTPWIGWPGPEPSGGRAPPPCAGQGEIPPPRGVRGELAYSPDGKRVVFERAIGGEDLLWIANIDGSQARELTRNRRGGSSTCPCDTRPSFSPDGTRIAFIRTLSGRKAALFVVNVDGTRVKQLTPWSRGIAGEVDWSPDGSPVVSNP
jgi:dipeptidyl aminopeptidase/acylaminoacyl peptidase